MELESKTFGSEGSLEVKKAFEDFLAGFEAFKQGNDERLKGLEKRSADVLADEKVARLGAALENQQRHIDGLLLEAARPALGGEKKSFDPRITERSRAFDRYVRRGEGLAALEVKAMSEGTNKMASSCSYLPWGAVRLLDAAASGADPDIARAAIAPGQPDDAASEITLPDLVALLAADLGIARQNADQLEHLERAITARNEAGK